jgi:hypothetical protein
MCPSPFAAGAEDVLGLPIPVVSKNFSTFDGLVTALEGHFRLHNV